MSVINPQSDRLVRWLNNHQTWFKPQIYEIIVEDLHQDFDIAETQSLILDELIQLTLNEMTTLKDCGWFHSVDIEENDGMLFLSGETTSKLRKVTGSTHSIINFWAENGQINHCHNESLITPPEFKKLIDLAEAYYQLSYNRY